MFHHLTTPLTDLCQALIRLLRFPVSGVREPLDRIKNRIPFNDTFSCFVCACVLWQAGLLLQINLGSLDLVFAPVSCGFLLLPDLLDFMRFCIFRCLSSVSRTSVSVFLYMQIITQYVCSVRWNVRYKVCL